ncbi:ES1 protein [Blattella germanica]|nr:ES1 protein [Blattella germanica]
MLRCVSVNVIKCSRGTLGFSASYSSNAPKVAVGAPEEGAARNVLAESARIARGQIHPLSELSASTASAVIFPGGFGAAKNL